MLMLHMLLQLLYSRAGCQCSLRTLQQSCCPVLTVLPSCIRYSCFRRQLDFGPDVMLGPRLESLPCTQLSPLLLMRAGKLVHRYLNSAFQRALACWAAEAMLQFLFLLLHKLRALLQTPNRTATKASSNAKQGSSAYIWNNAFAPSSDQQSQAPGGISDMTCAEVPLSSVAQVKAQIGKPSIVPLMLDIAGHNPAVLCVLRLTHLLHCLFCCASRCPAHETISTALLQDPMFWCRACHTPLFNDMHMSCCIQPTFAPSLPEPALSYEPLSPE